MVPFKKSKKLKNNKDKNYKKYNFFLTMGKNIFKNVKCF